MLEEDIRLVLCVMVGFIILFFKINCFVQCLLNDLKHTIFMQVIVDTHSLPSSSPCSQMCRMLHKGDDTRRMVEPDLYWSAPSAS